MLTWREIQEAECTDDGRPFGRMCSGIWVRRQGRALILDIPDDGFKVLSSGFTNGGLMDSPEHVVNISGMGGKAENSCMVGGIDEYDECTLSYVARLGLNPGKTVCMGTAANMDNAVVTTMTSVDGIDVSTAITGGIRHNGGRSGDPASFDEAKARYREKPGTIIILMSIDAELSEAAMLEAMLIATGAKSCVIQELQARSLYSKEVATGSGTDQVAVICRKHGQTPICRLDRGSGLAACIARCVKECLREALDRQSGMNTALQSDPAELMKRFGITEDSMHGEIHYSATMGEIESAKETAHRDRYLAAMTLAVMEIEDGIRKGLIDADEGLEAASRICES
ncbi:MAG: adenosylcobinamide amidohydrolase, partial [Candidatus Methanomethylophilaceae archaeon]|nr:adenosylcobinamide amidohydrolase [Candidatus Methanomethylophilaceae archaeon]